MRHFLARWDAAEAFFILLHEGRTEGMVMEAMKG